MSAKYLNIIVLPIIIALSNVASADVNQRKKSNITIYQVFQRVLDRYSSLKVAEMEVEQAGEQKQQIQSNLGWVLNSSAGIARDLTGLGTPSDRLDVTSSINRQLKSGSTLSLSGGYRYEDSSLSFSPVLPNPAHTTRLDLSYRIPLSQGNGNPIYKEGIVSADSGHKLAKANLLSLRISLADQVKELYYSFVLTQKRLENINESVQRTKELSLFVDKNFKLGLSEKKDRLQINAQLHSKLAELSTVELQLNQLKNSLNRLMLESLESHFQPILINELEIKPSSLNELIETIESYHPSINIARANLDVALSQLNSAKDIKKDNLDLVMSLGTRTSNGQSATTNINEKDWAGSVRIEYKHLFDDDGVTSKYKQALLEKNIALQNIVRMKEDIRYSAFALTSEIDSAKIAVSKSYQRLNSESKKLKEVEKRFRSGRADTAQVIQFQNEHSIANLNYQNQKIDLNKRIVTLQIYSGQFWDNLNMNREINK